MTRKHQPARSWPVRAERVGELLPRGRLHPAVLAWASRRRGTEPWAVAFSGGADSLALLLLLWAHWPERRRRLVALHFNHRLRGRAAAADAAFCQRVCRGLGVRLRMGRWEDAPRQGASESAARTARHDFFAREMAKLKAGALWLAHQQDDIAETMLMRLARGSGTGGLAAPRPVSTVDRRLRLRPLLTLPKSALLDALREAGTEWREDASNAGPDFFRNRIRRDVLPAWAQASGRNAPAGAALSRERLEEDDAALEAWLDELAPLGRRGVLNLSRLTGRPTALWRRALHRWLLAVRPDTDLSRQGFEALLAAVRRGVDTRFSLGSRGFAMLRQGKLKFQRFRLGSVVR
ncbi:MAG: tRNA lysidine(34) synthetase TilS [Opitutales bacterium]